MTRARHRVFIVPRLVGSLVAFAAFPIYLVLRGVPSLLEVVAFAALTVPILLSWFLSRTGRYEEAHVLSSLALSGVVMAVATITGGIESVAVIWLVLLPLEAALSASLRVLAFASGLALACIALLLALGHLDMLPPSEANLAARDLFSSLVVGLATIYAAALAFGAQSLARTSSTLLNAEEDRYRMLAQNMSDVISRHSSDGSVGSISAGAETMLGVPTSRLLGHGLFDRVHLADRPTYLTALSDAARGAQACNVEIRIRRDSSSGEGVIRHTEFIWVEMRCRPLAPAAGSDLAETGVVAVMRDINERKAQEHALDLACAAAEQADASKTRFLATMSHELRTPLNAIIGFSEMIVREDDLMLDSVRRREYAQLINDSGQHLLSVVNAILDMSKMEAGHFEIVPEPFAPLIAVVNCCNLLALNAQENGVDLVMRASDDLPEMTGDPRAFKQIVLNLVANAIKFTERGGTATVHTAVEGSRLVLRVSDTGVGISTDDLKHIGDPFFQAGKTYGRRHEGTGLGLSIVKNLVGLHGGDMAVQSKLGEGTTVTVALPLTCTRPALKPSSNIATLNPLSRYPQAQAHQVKKSA